MDRWKEYFQELLNRHERQEKSQQERIQANIDEGDLGIEISIEEVVDIVKSLKYGKAPGHDKITTEMIKRLGNNGMEMLCQLLNKAWHSGEVPEDWKVGIIIPIHKNGDSKDCKIYRGVTQLSTAAKIYESILERKLKQAIEYQLEESQSGFRKGRCIQDHIFTIKQITEKALIQQKVVYLAFVDLEKAFDSVSQSLVWESLGRRGINGKLLRGIIRRTNITMDITIDEERIEQVDKYKYLGVLIQREGNMEEEVNERLSNAAKLYHTLSKTFLTKREITNTTKMAVYKTVYRPILLGEETWNLTNSSKSKIQAMEMKFLRRILGLTRRDRVRNEIVRAELGVEPIIQRVENQQLRWFGHLNRMQDNMPVKQVWESRSQSR
ncbi:uncharacterized protein LOC116168986 [Photinus pyralis]|uniref:uncharacterized protein LOC116168986 n=1 Tax=Photinus pyralis TaxID=7054 RepID=UPI0012672CA2|nr:uncharacterized protein LOC116168986 [Photinus pyralis]